MPAPKRIEFLPHFGKFVPSVLDQINVEDHKFEQIVIAFPYTVRDWFDKLDSSKRQLVRTALQKRVTLKVFKAIVKNTLRMKLQGTTMKSNQERLTIETIFKEDASAMAITLKLELPPCYPVEPIVLRSNIGDIQMSASCDERIKSAMMSSQSVEEGIRTWHSFVIQRVLDSAPCTICYSYFDSVNHSPSVECETCGNNFHNGCLKRWFECCHRPRCPYCSSPWRAKNKAKKGL